MCSVQSTADSCTYGSKNHSKTKVRLIALNIINDELVSVVQTHLVHATGQFPDLGDQLWLVH